MTTLFVSRHPGAIEWIKTQGLHIDRWVTHLDITEITFGDTVIGNLPVPMVFAINHRGAQYIHLAVEVPASMRGQELSSNDLALFGAKLQAYTVQAVE